MVFVDRDRLLSPEEWLVWRHRERFVSVSNGPGSGPMPTPGRAEAVKAAWLPVRRGQGVPLEGEDAPWPVCSHGGDPCDCLRSSGALASVVGCRAGARCDAARACVSSG